MFFTLTALAWIYRPAHAPLWGLSGRPHTPSGLHLVWGLSGRHHTPEALTPRSADAKRIKNNE